MANQHSVEDHLRLLIKDYDVGIRTLVPDYDEMLESGVEILQSIVQSSSLILDLGCGTGRFAQAALDKLPEARFELIDIDEKMLAHVQARFGIEAKRVHFRHGSFFAELPKCDAVVASLSLHHICELRDKLKVYENIYSCLNPGGLLLVMDASVPSDTNLSQHTFDYWKKHMQRNGITLKQAADHLATWKKEENYFSIHEELNALVQAGFKQPECFWRKGPVAIYGGLK